MLTKLISFSLQKPKSAHQQFLEQTYIALFESTYWYLRNSMIFDYKMFRSQQPTWPADMSEM